MLCVAPFSWLVDMCVILLKTEDFMKTFKEFLIALHDTLLIAGIFSVFIVMLFVIA